MDCWAVERLDCVEAEVDGVLTWRTKKGSKAPTGVALCVRIFCELGIDCEDEFLLER